MEKTKYHLNNRHKKAKWQNNTNTPNEAEHSKHHLNNFFKSIFRCTNARHANNDKREHDDHQK